MKDSLDLHRGALESSVTKGFCLSIFFASCRTIKMMNNGVRSSLYSKPLADIQCFHYLETTAKADGSSSSKASSSAEGVLLPNKDADTARK
ncbi:hypothetical protein OH492_01725 [Vibrio chagasii]|nr:hypothetical protein [Vibrio chagasii]